MIHRSYRRAILSCLFAALMLCLTLAAPAQTFDATNIHQPTDLYATWLVHAGDNPSFAAPDLDDSQWTRFDAAKPISTIYPQHPEIVWYRLHVKVGPRRTGLALEETNLSKAFELYANGRRILTVGSIRPFKAYDSEGLLLASIPAAATQTGTFVLAIRAYISPQDWAGQYAGFYPTNLTLGDEAALHDHIWLTVIGAHAVAWAATLISLFVSVAALLLYTAHRNHKEYLWLAFQGLITTCTFPLNVYPLLHPYPNWGHLLYVVPYILAPYVSVRMYFAFVHHRISWRVNIFLAIALGAAALQSVLRFAGHSTERLNAVLQFPLLALLAVVLPLMLLQHWRRGNREAGILLVPVLLSSLYYYLVVALLTLYFSFAGNLPVQMSLSRRLQALQDGLHVGPFLLPAETLLDILASLALALIMLLRTVRISRQQASLEAELEAAREVQQILLQDESPAIPGYTLETAYQPAQQVGGDFFQVLPTSNPPGAALVLVGDVSGKGLKAAMNVSLLVGAIKILSASTSSPAAMLAGLNSGLHGRLQNGFATCLALLITPEGVCTLSTAGHPGPFLNDREVALRGSLPLGISQDAEYTETTFYVQPGDLLALYSDGLLEARCKHGELYGFDRLQTLFAGRPTAQRALEAAIDFGQDDDITVLTITRCADPGFEIRSQAGAFAAS